MPAHRVGHAPTCSSALFPTRRSNGARRLSARIWPMLALAFMIAARGIARASGPEGQLTWGVHVSLAPTWFDPAEMPGIITPYMVYYALHDALVKPMPGKPFASSLAESWSLSDDGLIYEFVLRTVATFING